MEALQSTGDDPERMLGAALEALKEFPWDWQFLFRAAVAEMRMADIEQDPRMRHDILSRGAAHAQLATEMDPENESLKWIRAEIQKRLEEEPGSLD